MEEKRVEGDVGGSSAPVFFEPKVTFDNLPEVVDTETFEDEHTPERLKAIIRHMRRTSGRNDRSLLVEYQPGTTKRFVFTFPEGDERHVCRVLAEEMRSLGFEDKALAERLNQAEEKVERAHAECEKLERMNVQIAALAGDLLEALRRARDLLDEYEYVDAKSGIDDLLEQLRTPGLAPFVSLMVICRAQRDANAAQNKVDRVAHAEGLTTNADANTNDEDDHG